MANDRFSDEYKAHSQLLKTVQLPGLATSANLKKALGDTCPNPDSAGMLNAFRKIAHQTGEAAFILKGADLDASGTGIPPAQGLKKAALLKSLRHRYLAGERGAQKVWVFSTPKAYRAYPLDQITAHATSYAKLTVCLNDVTAMFSDETKERFGDATPLGLSWCLAAQSVLSTAATDVAAMAKVKRWFAEATTSASDLNQTIANVLAGFKTMTNTMNGGTFVITDMPKDRANPAKDLTEAYIFNLIESPKTVYVEKALFENDDVSVLHDLKKNWARIIVHEVSHIDATTVDNAYAWQGIGVGTGLSAAKAAVNADTWAFFAADCGGALTAGDITRAGAGSNGNLDKLAKNWNEAARGLLAFRCTAGHAGALCGVFSPRWWDSFANTTCTTRQGEAHIAQFGPEPRWPSAFLSHRLRRQALQRNSQRRTPRSAPTHRADDGHRRRHECAHRRGQGLRDPTHPESGGRRPRRLFHCLRTRCGAARNPDCQRTRRTIRVSD